MTSTATNAGSVSITVYFKQGTDPDMAAVNVQNRVSRATGQLPGEVTQVGVTTMKRQTSILQMFSLHSPDNSYVYSWQHWQEQYNIRNTSIPPVLHIRYP